MVARIVRYFVPRIGRCPAYRLVSANRGGRGVRLTIVTALAISIRPAARLPMRSSVAGRLVIRCLAAHSPIERAVDRDGGAALSLGEAL